MGSKSADVIVVGLGAHGSASAWQLAKRGSNVIGFDAFTPPHTLGSSHGDTRVIRAVYAEHPDYVPIMLRGYEIWRELESAVADDGEATELLRIVGGLTVGRPEGDGVRGVKRSAKEHNLEIEVLEPAEIRRRWPQFQPRDNMIGTFDFRSGVLFPEKCVSLLTSIKPRNREQTFTTTNRCVAGIQTERECVSIPMLVNTPPIRSFSRLARGIQPLSPSSSCRCGLSVRFSSGSSLLAARNSSGRKTARTTRGNTPRAKGYTANLISEAVSRLRSTTMVRCSTIQLTSTALSVSLTSGNCATQSPTSSHS